MSRVKREGSGVGVSFLYSIFFVRELCIASKIAFQDTDKKHTIKQSTTNELENIV